MGADGENVIFIIMELSNNIIKSNAVNAFISIEANHYSFMFKITVKVLL
jgi:hypothetical protein